MQMKSMLPTARPRPLMMIGLAASLSAFFAFACTPPVAPLDAGGEPEPAPVVEPEEDAGTPEPGPPPIDAGPIEGPVVENTDNGDGTTTTVVAAVGRDAIYFSFATQAQVEPADPLASNDWDLGFLRFNVGVNGGSYFGNGNGGVLPLENTVTFDDVTAAPEAGYLTDLEDDDLDGNPEFIIGDEDINPWYDYDELTHVLTTSNRVFIIRDASGDNYFAIVVLDYYNDAGESGFMKFQWKAVTAPNAGPTDGGVVLDAGAAGDAGPTDAGVPSDAGPTDAGATPTDAGVTDAG